MAHLVNVHVLVVGIANFRHINPLPTTVLEDARAKYQTLINESLCAYYAEDVTLLLDDAATQDGLHRTFANLATKNIAESTVFIYVSSHGARLDSSPHTGKYLLPVDAR